jgi:hypothetical protein
MYGGERPTGCPFGPARSGHRRSADRPGAGAPVSCAACPRPAVAGSRPTARRPRARSSDRPSVWWPPERHHSCAYAKATTLDHFWDRLLIPTCFAVSAGSNSAENIPSQPFTCSCGLQTKTYPVSPPMITLSGSQTLAGLTHRSIHATSKNGSPTGCRNLSWPVRCKGAIPLAMKSRCVISWRNLGAMFRCLLAEGRFGRHGFNCMGINAVTAIRYSNLRPCSKRSIIFPA